MRKTLFLLNVGNLRDLVLNSILDKLSILSAEKMEVKMDSLGRGQPTNPSPSI